MQNGQTHTPKPTLLAQRRADAAERRAASADGRARETKAAERRVAAAEARTAEALREAAHLASTLADVRQDRDRWRTLAERMAAAIEGPGAVAPPPAPAASVATDGDLLHGFEAIGLHLGVSKEAARLRANKERMPFVRDGRRIWIRKASLNAWLAEREAAALAATKQGGR